jgi:hypothetical protein
MPAQSLLPYQTVVEISCTSAWKNTFRAKKEISPMPAGHALGPGCEARTAAATADGRQQGRERVAVLDNNTC